MTILSMVADTQHRFMTTTHELAQKLMETMPALGRSMARSVRTQNAPADSNGIIHIRTLHMLMEGPRTFKDLCAFRGVAPPTLSRSIDAMVKRGWVERVPHPDDKRKLLLQATDEGQRHFKELVTDSRDHLAQVLQALNSDERNTIAQALDLLKKVLDTP